jgi:hypothetical protein
MRHCERSEAIQSMVQGVFAVLDCFVASLLAMTVSSTLLRGNERS